MVTRITHLINHTRRTPVTGIGKPEALKNQLACYWSRRITDEHRRAPASTDEHRLVDSVEENQIVIIAARHHY